jgi:small-conductance mechanosensitive channel
MVVLLAGLLEETATAPRDGVVTAVPRVISAVLFTLLAYVGIRVVLSVLRRVLARMFSDRQELVVQLLVTVVGVFLWFGAALAVLKILGMGEVAASPGTAVGFVALGVSYALSEMIGDTVAGIYLLWDPDFEEGDRVVVDDIEATVAAIELRKSRFVHENGDTTVLANRNVESEWTKRAE